jgi:two-component system sensor histidine kinase CpxA
VKTRFPLFARLLLWFFLNLLVLVAGLLLMVRVQFGSLNNWLLPQSSQDEIQAMTATLIGDLAHSPRETWGDKLSALDAAYKMDFALYDSRGNWIEGAPLDPPDDVHHAMIFAQRPRGGALPPPEAAPAPATSPEFNPDPERPLPPEDFEGRPPPQQRGTMPAFPKSVMHSGAAYWLLVRLPPEPFRADGPITLAGRTPKLGVSPLLFDPDPWLLVAVGIVVFSALFWLPMARSLTRAISKMTQATESIAEGRFDVQLADNRSDELGRLGSAINRMAGRLKEFVTGQKRFLGDAAHELTSPLARMEIALGILEERAIW